MGKNKKNNSLFKVAGAKSLKVKVKAKVFKNKRKHVNIKNKNKGEEIDKVLLQLEDEIRSASTSKKVAPENLDKSALPTVYTVDALETIKNSEETLQNFDKMNL